MLTIRLARIGKSKHPTYRFVVSEKSKDTRGDFLEDLGFYNPHTNPSTVQLKEERIKYWLSKGAQPSPTVHNILVDKNLISKSKVRVVKIKKKSKKEVKADKESTVEESKDQKSENKKKS